MDRVCHPRLDYSSRFLSSSDLDFPPRPERRFTPKDAANPAATTFAQRQTAARNVAKFRREFRKKKSPTLK
jgi:hypothetical protein